MGTVSISPEVVGAIAAAVALIVSALINAFIARLSQKTKGKAETADAAESLSSAASTLVGTYREEVSRLQGRVQSMEESLVKSAAMGEEIGRLQADRANCIDRERAMGARVEALQIALTDAQNRISVLEKERLAATAGSAVRDKEIAHLRGQVELLTGKTVSLQSQLEVVTRERDELRAKIAALTEELNALRAGVEKANGFVNGNGSSKGESS